MSKNNTKSKTKTKNEHILLNFIKFAFKIDKGYFLPLIFSCIVNSLRGILGAYYISIIISYIEKGNKMNAIYAGIVITIIEVVLYFFDKLIIKLRKVSLEDLKERVYRTLSGKIMSLPFRNLEDEHYLELKENAFMGIVNMGAIDNFFNSFVTIVTNSITAISLASIITNFNGYLLYAIIGSIALTILTVLLNTKKLMKFYQDLLPINFKYSYYVDTLLGQNGAKDFRLYNTYDALNDKYYLFCQFINKQFNNIVMLSGGFAAVLSAIQYCLIGIVYIVVGVTTINQNLSISEFSLIVSSVIMFTISASLIIKSSSNFMQSIQYVKPVLEFMNLQEDKDEGTLLLDQIHTISFEHVSFTYPNTTKLVLDDVSFDICENQKISIVGLNGAGKTTIVKLLCKMYKPDQGEIKMNGKNIYEYQYQSYMDAISSVFQDYQLFNYSILDNIKPNMKEEDGISILKDVQLMDAINQLPKGIHSNIGKEYEIDGIDLSAGQKQKISIARAIAKPASLLILDEPTSALDPIAEAEIYENFNTLAKNRMAIYISHRMSSSIFCDKILVLNYGKVEDFASHVDVMKKQDSLYYQLFTTQAKNYQFQEKE